MGVIVEAAASAEFLAGLRWGGIAAAIGLIVGVVWRRRLGEPAPVMGIAAVVAAATALAVVRPLNPSLLAGLFLLAGAGAIFPWTCRVPALPFLAALPGAWLIAGSGIPGPGWAIPLAAVVTAVAGPVVSWFDRRANPSALPSLLFAISAAGVWVTVPDTEEALVLLGALTAPVLLAWPLRVARLGAVGGHLLVALYMWVVVWGGRGREGSIVGAVAAVGMLIAAPMGAWIPRRPLVITTGWFGIVLIALHFLVVAVTTRVGGLRDTAADAGAVAIPTVIAAMLVWVAVEALGPRPDRGELS